MPIAFKEWAVTVRALAEGEQLITLRKPGIRPQAKPLRLAHERFFLYPTFDHETGDLVRESHQPELRRALEEGIPCMLRRSPGFDVPDMLAGGPRDVLVPASGAQAAREALAWEPPRGDGRQDAR